MGRILRNILILACVIGAPIVAQGMADYCGVSPYTQSMLVRVGLNISLSVGLCLIIGFAGQFSIGHAGFMSLGAFASGLFTMHVITRMVAGVSPAFLEGVGTGSIAVRSGLLILTVLVGMVVAVVASIVIGLPALRLRGDYLAIATLGFGEITYNLLTIAIKDALKSNDTAFYIPPEAGFMQMSVNIASAWILALMSILIVRNLVNSTSGRALPAIRENEIAASSIGIRNTRYKLIAFVVGSLLAGAAGVLEAHLNLQVNPANYRFDRSIEMVVPVVLGGSGSLTGTVLAAGLFTYLLERLREMPAGYQAYRQIVYAGVLVLFMIVRPQGLLGRFELSDLWTWIARRKRSTAVNPQASRAMAQTITRPSADLNLTCTNLTIRFGGLTAACSFLRAAHQLRYCRGSPSKSSS